MSTDDRFLTLQWELSSLEPKLRVDGNQPYYAEEILDPEDFTDASSVQEYFSLPERLTHISWVMDHANSTAEQQVKLEQFNRYMQFACSTKSFVSTITGWLHRWISAQHIIHRFYQEHQEFCDYWYRLRPILSEIQKDGDSEVLRRDLEEQLLEYRDFNSRYPEFRLSRLLASFLEEHEEPQTDLRSLSEQLYKEFNRHHNKLLNTAVSPGSKDQRKLKSVLQQMQKLEQDAAAVQDIRLPKQEFEISDRYCMSVMGRIQDSSLEMNRRFNALPGDFADIDKLLEAFSNTLVALNIKNGELEKYKTTRCIALLCTDDGKRYLAFSGFCDCEHDIIAGILGCKADSLSGEMRKISSAFNAVYINTSELLANWIYNYTLDSTCQFVKRASLGEMVNLVYEGRPDTQDRAYIKRSYSCCERKILAHLEREHLSRSIRSAVLHVSFMPCIRCYAALQSWRFEHRVALQIDYPESIFLS